MRGHKISGIISMIAAAVLLLSAGTAVASIGEDTDGDGVINIDVTASPPRCAWNGNLARVYAEVYTKVKAESPIDVLPVYNGGSQEGVQVPSLGADMSTSVAVKMPAGSRLTVYARGGTTGDFAQTEFFSIGDCRPEGRITQPWVRGVRLFNDNRGSNVSLKFTATVYRSNGTVYLRKSVTVSAGQQVVTTARGLPRGAMVVLRTEENRLLAFHNLVS